MSPSISSPDRSCESPDSSRSLCRRVSPGVADKLIALGDHVFGAFEEIAPYAGWLHQLRKRPAERLNRQPTLVSARFDGLKDGLEVDVTAPWDTTVVVADVNMRDLCSILRKGLRQVYLFNVGVEGVEHGLEMGMVDPANVSGGSSHGRQEIAFEAVQKFDCQDDALALGLLGDRAVDLRGAFEFFLGRSSSGEYPQCLMERPAEDIRTENRGVANEPSVVPPRPVG